MNLKHNLSKRFSSALRVGVVMALLGVLFLRFGSSSLVLADEATQSATLSPDASSSVSLESSSTSSATLSANNTSTSSAVLSNQTQTSTSSAQPTPVPSTPPSSSSSSTSTSQPTDASLVAQSVVLNQSYTAPTNSSVKVVFTSLPSTGGSLNITEQSLSSTEVTQFGLSNGVVYDITSSMTNGTFTYDLTLPIPSGVNTSDLVVKYASSIAELSSAQTVTSQSITINPDNTVTIHGLNHFTVFVVTNPNTVSNCNSVTVGTTPGSTCFSTVQAAVDSASNGDTINIGAGTYSETVNVTKQLTFDGVGNPSVTSFILWSTNVTINGVSAGSVVSAVPSASFTNPVNSSNKTNVSISGTGLANANINYTISDNGNAHSVSGSGAVSASGVINISGINLSALNDGSITLSLTLNDGAGHTSSAATSTSFKDTVSPVAPTVNVTNPVNLSNVASVSVSGTGEAGATANYTISDGVHALARGSVTVNDSGNYSITGISLVGLNDGSLTLSVTLTDGAGNTSLATSTTITKDTVAPSLTSTSITSSNSNGSFAKAGDSVTLTFSSSEAIQTPSVTIAGHSVVASNLGGNNWRANYTFVSGDTQGLISYSVNFTDLAGNSNSVAASSSIVFDSVAPSVSIGSVTTSNSNSSYAKVGDTITVNFTSSETIQNPIVTISGQSALVVNGGGNNWRATYTMASSDTEGLIAYTINFTDLAGNSGAAISNNSTITFDKTAPTTTSVSVTSGGLNTSYAKSFDQITLILFTSETVNTPSVTIAGHNASVSSLGGNAYIAHVTMQPADTEGLIPYTLTLVDLAGNTTVVNATSNVTFDRTPPALNSITVVNTNSASSFAKVGDTITITFTSSEVVQTPDISLGSISLTPTNVSGNTWSAQYTFSGSDIQGGYASSIYLRDLAYNTFSYTGSSITFDTTSPVVSANNPSNSWNTSNINITLSASDNLSGLNNVRYSWDTPATATSGTLFTDGVVINIPSDGSHTLYLYADDNSGNSQTFSGTYLLDRANPTVSVTNSGAFWQNSLPTMVVTASDPTPGSGIASLLYGWDGVANINVASGTDLSSTFLGDGIHTLNLLVTDNAGRTFSLAATYQIDRVAPLVNAGSNTTVNSVFTTLASASDATSGIATYSWSATGVGLFSFGTPNQLNTTFSAVTDGVYTLTLTVTDNAGNSNSSSFNLTWDTTAPATTDNTDSLWHSSSVSTTLSCSDNLTGCAQIVYTSDGSDPVTSATRIVVLGNSASFTLNTEGVYNIQYYSIDGAGNQEVTRSAVVKIDTTLPTLSSDNVSAGWFTSNPNITLSVNDLGGSGLNNVRYSWDTPATASTGTIFTNGAVINIPSDGVHTLYLYADDSAGNSQTFSAVYKLDTADPSVSATGSSVGWQQSVPSIAVSASDTLPGSGVASITYAWDGGVSQTTTNGADLASTLPGDGVHTLVLVVTDNAGRSTSFSGNYLIDRVDPALVVSGSSNGWQTVVPSILVSASDATPGSGIALIKYSWDGGSLVTISSGTDLASTFPGDGIHTLTVVVTDNSGRVNSFTGTYKVDTQSPIVNATGSSNSWQDSLPSIVITGSDATSGVASILYGWDGAPSIAVTSGTDIASTFPGDGSHTLNILITDNAGLTQNFNGNYLIDRVNPVVNAGSDVTANNIFTSVATASDITSGIQTYSWSYTGPGTLTFGTPSALNTTITPTTNGVYVLTLTVTDNAGNSSSSSFNLTWDNSAPTTTDNTDNLWHTSVVTISLTCSDNLTGCAQTKYTTDGSDPVTSPTAQLGNTITLSTDSVYTIKYYSIDNAGNAEAVVTAINQVKVDLTKPVTTDNIPSSWSNAPVTVTLNCSDNLSGCAQIVYTTDNSDPLTSATRIVFAGNTTFFTLSTDGVYTIKYYSTDLAGNVEGVVVGVNQVKIDQSVPLVSGVSLSNTTTGNNTLVKNGDGVVLTATVTDNNQSLLTTSMISADFSSLGGGVSVNPISYDMVTGLATWAPLIVSGTTNGVVSISVNALDIANNPALVQSGSIISDNTPPTLTSVSISATNNPANLHDVITLTFSSSEPIQTPSVTMAGQNAQVSYVSGNTWKADLGVWWGQPDGAVAFIINFADLAGNTALGSLTTDGSSVSIHKFIPLSTPSAPSAPSSPAPSSAPSGVVGTVGSSLGGVVDGNSQVTLSWGRASGSVSSYMIFYGLTPAANQYGVPNTGNVTSYTIGGLMRGATYYFKIVALNNSTPGAFSKTIVVRVLPGQRSQTPVLGLATAPIRNTQALGTQRVDNQPSQDNSDNIMSSETSKSEFEFSPYPVASPGLPTTGNFSNGLNVFSFFGEVIHKIGSFFR